jgi:6-pyruvoyltetrahydropterin/6-carboxytetrahydropterin synthase
MSWELVVKQKFSAAHYLQHYRGKCEKMHGHTFEIEAWFSTTTLDPSGISIDFSEIKAALNELLPDHQLLNEIYDFSPSAENLARYFFQQLRQKYPVAKVMVWESENAGALYHENQ